MASPWIDEYIAAWNRHDGEQVVSFMHDNVTFEDHALGEHFEGAAAVKEFVRQTEASFSSDFRFETTYAVTGESGYAFEWTMSGTNDRADTARGLPATGKTYAIRGVSVGRLVDGKISENRDYWNQAAYLMQVGLMPAPPTAH